MSKLTEERQKLADALDAANQRHREALRCARQEGRADAAQEVTADLLVFSKDLEAKRVTGTLTELAEKHRELTCEFLRAVEERGLVVTPAGTERGWGVAITDPAIDLEIESTLAEASEARAALAAFDAEHGAGRRAKGRRGSEDPRCTRRGRPGCNPRADQRRARHGADDRRPGLAVARRGRNTRSVNSWLPPAFAETVDRVAAVEGRSKASLVRRALLAWVAPGGHK